MEVQLYTRLFAKHTTPGMSSEPYKGPARPSRHSFCKRGSTLRDVGQLVTQSPSGRGEVAVGTDLALKPALHTFPGHCAIANFFLSPATWREHHHYCAKISNNESNNNNFKTSGPNAYRLIFTTLLMDTYYFHVHFTEEETEASLEE